MKKITALAGILLLSASCVFAQAADDGFIVPVDKDLTNAIKESTVSADPSETSSKSSNLAQGIWIEVTGENDFITRDLATGKTKGYELDSSHFASNANWWFWGDIGSSFHLDAEISVWDFDKVLFQSNSYAANIADVTAGDGLETLAALFFSPIYNGNDSGVGSLNKMGLTLKTPYVEAVAGYGNLKANGMSEFKGIYNVIDRWNDVGKGFLELRTGKSLSSIGRFNINAVAALSQMRGTYGMYDFIDVTYSDNYEAAVTFGSKTTADELFFYNDYDTNALSAYVRAKPLDFIQIEGHGIGTFGSTVDFSKDALAAALRVSYLGKDDFLTVSLEESYAGSDVNSVWGSDGQSYDDIRADTLTTVLNASWASLNFIKVSLDSDFIINDTSALSDGLMTLRAQPIFDLDLNSLINKDFTVSLYGVAKVDRLASSTSSNREIVPYLDEAGLEVSLSDLVVDKVLFDYGVSLSYNDWESGHSYDYKAVFNSFMLSVDVNSALNVHAGAIVRAYAEKDDTSVPFGFATGLKINNIPLPGSPFVWTHFAYGMNPYEDNNYTLYRADDVLNKPSHRTYLLNSLEDSLTKSQISFGLIWSL